MDAPPVAQALSGSSLLRHLHLHSHSAANNAPAEWVLFAGMTDIGSRSGITFTVVCILPLSFLRWKDEEIVGYMMKEVPQGTVF